MTLRERIRIRAAWDRIWPLIADPVRMADWNPKVVSVDRDSPRTLRPGERFRLLYRMGGRHRASNAEVIECLEPRELVIRHHCVWKSIDRYADERYSLRSSPDTTHLTQEIDITGSGVPFPLQVLAWLIHRVGEPIGKPHLATLKELAEAGDAETPRTGSPHA
jgi:Polyketide cyclase / dehydrase and lipid transport